MEYGPWGLCPVQFFVERLSVGGEKGGKGCPGLAGRSAALEQMEKRGAPGKPPGPSRRSALAARGVARVSGVRSVLAQGEQLWPLQTGCSSGQLVETPVTRHFSKTQRVPVAPSAASTQPWAACRPPGLSS